MIGALAGIGAQLGAGAIGEWLAGKSESEQMAILRQAMDEAGNIQLPVLQQMVAEELGPSAGQNVYADPRLVAAQFDVLSGLKEQARNGLSIGDKAAWEELANRSGTREAAGRGAILESMQSRGLSGSGLEFDAAMRNAQDAAANRSREATGLAARGEDRRFQALTEGGRLAGSMRGQGFSEAEKRAAAQDEISRQNVSARTRAQMYNLGLPQQDYANRLSRHNAKFAGSGRMSDVSGRQAQGTRDLWSGIGQAGYEIGRGFDNNARGLRPQPNRSPYREEDEFDWT